MPRDEDGRVRRLADPRQGTWFGLANDGGPEADPTRGVNCLDGVLSLFDTYLHGRPRVSAPRTFDSYAHGDPTRPLGAETAGLSRIENTVKGQFQGLCPYVGATDHARAKQSVDLAMTNLSNHLHNLGHGSFAFIITDSEGGSAHAWTAVNHNGTILFLDPQTRRISETVPLYQNRGAPSEANVVAMDALVVDSGGQYSPLPFHRAGIWSHSALEPTGTDPAGAAPADDGQASAADSQRLEAKSIPAGSLETEAANAERRMLDALPVEQQRELFASEAQCDLVADRVMRELSGIVAALEGFSGAERPVLVDTEHRVKSAHSIARAYSEESKFEELDLTSYLESLKDRVRFSIQVPEVGYVRSVAAILDSLRDRDYRIVKLRSFWADEGRHNGLNVTVSDRAGFTLEIQFPTELSRTVGKMTHHYYEIVRQSNFDVGARVEAFLTILRINKESGINQHRPTGLESLGTVANASTTFARWIQGVPTGWARYLEQLGRRQTSFDEVLRDHGLNREDAFGRDRRDGPDA